MRARPWLVVLLASGVAAAACFSGSGQLAPAGAGGTTNSSTLMSSSTTYTPAPMLDGPCPLMQGNCSMVSGASGCYDSIAAQTLDPAITETSNQPTCSKAELNGFFTACFSQAATQTTCDPWIKDMANMACRGCML